MADDGTRASDYDDPMSERLLGIAADVLRSFGSAFGGRHLAIVGGAVPGLLVPVAPSGTDAHVGTADLDLLLSLTCARSFASRRGPFPRVVSTSRISTRLVDGLDVVSRDAPGAVGDDASSAAR